MNTKLNMKQWSVASLAVFVIMTLFAFILTKLGVEPWAAPAQATGIQHDPATQRILIYLSRVFFAGLFTFVFSKGQEGKPGLGEGMRYGLWMGLLLYLPSALMNLAINDWPASSHVNRVVAGLVEAVLCGIVIAQLYKPNKA